MEDRLNRFQKDFRSQVEQIAQKDTTRLVSRQEIGSLNFEDLRTDVDLVISLYRALGQLRIELIPDQILSEAARKTSEIQKQLQRMESFSVDGFPNPAQVRTNIIQDFWRDSKSTFVEIAPIISYLRATDAEFESSRAQMGTLKARSEEAVRLAESKLAEADSILTAMRDRASSTGVEAAAPQFLAAAATYRKASRIWLAWATGLGTGSAVVLWNVMHNGKIDGLISEANTIQYLFAKFILISLLVSGTLWAARNYRAFKHLQVLNEHRHNSLSVFDVFKAAADTETRGAVLMETTRCIFQPATSGFVSTDDSALPAMRIMEIIKNAKPSQ